MQEIRWNPVLKWWVMVSSKRQDRPLLPRDHCPFCPDSTNVPKDYDVFAYLNDWPILKPRPPEVSSPSSFYRVAKSYGKCEVILYSPDHTHGQIYGYPFIPKKIEVELESCKEYFEKEKRCLYCQILEEELRFKDRIVDENESFVTFVPFFADYPYQVFIIPRKHKLSLVDFSQKDKSELSLALKRIVVTYDKLFDRLFPYMMCFHQKPTDGNDYPYYHFHIEFYPTLRSSLSQKFNASSETGSWTHGNPTSPEEKATELRDIMKNL